MMPILRIFSIVLLFDIKKPHTLRKLARFRDIQAPHELTYNYDATYDHLFFKHVEQIEWSFRAKSVQLLSSPTKTYSRLTNGVELDCKTGKNKLFYYHLKWENARLASAILCVSSRFFIVEPSPLKAISSSPANFSAMVFSAREVE